MHIVHTQHFCITSMPTRVAKLPVYIAFSLLIFAPIRENPCLHLLEHRYGVKYHRASNLYQQLSLKNCMLIICWNNTNQPIDYIIKLH